MSVEVPTGKAAGMATTVALLLLAAASVVGFPQGGPAESCDSTLPRHVYTTPKPAHESPYTFVASASRYSFQNVDGIQGGCPLARLSSAASPRRIPRITCGTDVIAQERALVGRDSVIA